MRIVQPYAFEMSGIAESTICLIIPEVCTALIYELSDEYVKFPKTLEEFLENYPIWSYYGSLNMSLAVSMDPICPVSALMAAMKQEKVITTSKCFTASYLWH